MNTKKLFACAVVLLLMGWGITSGVLAQENQENDEAQTGRSGAEHSLVFETLGSSSFAVDVWRIQCPSGTHHVRCDVQCTTFGHVCEVVLFKDGRASTRYAPSFNHPDAVLARGSGTYWCIIKKHESGSTFYDSLQQCENSSNGFINHTSHTLTQDQ